MRSRAKQSKADVSIRYLDSANGGGDAFEFKFYGLTDTAIKQLNCEPFVENGGVPVVRLVSETISDSEIYTARTTLIDALDSLEYAWVKVPAEGRLDEVVIQEAITAGGVCLNTLVGLRPGNARRSRSTEMSHPLPVLLKKLFTSIVTASTRHVPLLLIEDKPASDVPWQAMPLVSQAPAGVFDPARPFDNFLGRHFIIKRRSRDYHPPERLIIENQEAPVRMKFFQNGSLRASCKEADFLQKASEGRQLDLQGTPWPHPDAGTHADWVRLANDHKTVFLDGTICEGDIDHVHHYSCHHEFSALGHARTPQSTLHFRSASPVGIVSVTLEQLKRELERAKKGCLLAFLNACETGRDADKSVELQGLRGWMLRRLHFAAVIASETRTKDSSCGELSIAFYRHFFGGEDTGHALHSAIKEAAVRGDPTCLLFALHGESEVRIRAPFELAA